MPLGPIAEGLFDVVIAVAERAARAIAEATHATDPRVVRTIQFLIYLFIICPLILLAVTVIVAGARWLIGSS